MHFLTEISAGSKQTIVCQKIQSFGTLRLLRGGEVSSERVKKIGNLFLHQKHYAKFLKASQGED